MAETDLTTTETAALRGTTDSDCDYPYAEVGEYYGDTGIRREQRLLTMAKALGNAFRVYKDGTATYGIRGGKLQWGGTQLSYAGSAGNALTANQTTYAFLYIDGGALTVGTSTSGFPDPGTTPHLPLATIATGASGYDHDDITDYRMVGAFRIASGATAAELNTLTDGGNADGLHVHATAGLSDSAVSTAKIADDAVTQAKIAADAVGAEQLADNAVGNAALADNAIGNAELQDDAVNVAELHADVVGYLFDVTLNGADDADGTGTMTLQVKDAEGTDYGGYFLLTVWISDSSMGAPAAQTDFSVATGTEIRELTTDACYLVQTNASGQAVMNIDTATNDTFYVMAEASGYVHSGSVTITGN